MKNLSRRQRLIGLFVLVLTFVVCFAGSCDVAPSQYSSKSDVNATVQVGNDLAAKQPTPTDLNVSLERYNLIRRAYWVNGQREKAMAVSRPANVPLGYVTLWLEGVGAIGNFPVDGKVTSLNSFLTPDSEYYELVYGGTSSKSNKWLPDIDGSYGVNQEGCFFFTPDFKYIEHVGHYTYSDIPFEIENPILRTEAVK